jgi:hypothetical protein
VFAQGEPSLSSKKNSIALPLHPFFLPTPSPPPPHFFCDLQIAKQKSKLREQKALADRLNKRLTGEVTLPPPK